jgi:hypothetical protein
VKVIGVEGQVEVKLMSFVVSDGIGANESPPFDISSVGVPSAVDGVELLGVIAVVEIVWNGVLDEE